jgi:hypothetical protein
MGGVSRREVMKKAAVAGGVVWATPLLSTGTAWGQTSDPCACGDGALAYAKFAPGNSQTCQNQCLQPGTIGRLEFDCLVDAGVITVLDEVASNDDTASLQFNLGTRLFKLAIKSESACFVVRCNEGFSQLYLWSSSTNAEPFDDLHSINDPSAALGGTPIFQYFNGGVLCGNSAGDPCDGNVTRVDMTTADIPGNQKLNFIEMELCITNLSKINCPVIVC